MSKTSYQEYWKTVRTTAREKTDKKLGTSVRFLAIVVGGLSTAIASIFLGGNLITTLNVAFVTIAVNVAFWIIVWVGFFVYHWAYEPVVINNEKEGKLENLKSELEKIENNKKITRLLIEPKVNDYGNRINLEIKNKNSKNIMDCRARLVSGAKRTQ